MNEQLKQELINRNPDIIFFGESHAADSDFRRFFIEQLDGLWDLGFRCLALELNQELADPVNKFCDGDINFDELKSHFAATTSPNSFLTRTFTIDTMEAIKEWKANGGSLLFINSDDDSQLQNAKNDKGRDERMARRLLECKEKIVALVGVGHSFIRGVMPDRNDLFNIIQFLGKREQAFGPKRTNEQEQQAVADAMAYAFFSAAEKVQQNGRKVFRIGEIDKNLQVQLHNSYLPGFTLVWRLPEEPGRISFWFGIASDGRRSDFAPELVFHHVRLPLSSWDALFFSQNQIVSPTSEPSDLPSF